MEAADQKLQDSLTAIAAELFRFQGVFDKMLGKLDVYDQTKYASQFAWFSKRVTKALDAAGLRIVNTAGELYDPGMAVTPLNIDDFEPEDILFVAQMVEPIIMRGTEVVKTGTVILGRIIV